MGWGEALSLYLRQGLSQRQGESPSLRAKRARHWIAVCSTPDIRITRWGGGWPRYRRSWTSTRHRRSWTESWKTWTGEGPVVHGAGRPAFCEVILRCGILKHLWQSLTTL